MLTPLLPFLTLALSVSGDPAAPSGKVWVPPGSFTMGSAADGARPHERPARRVEVEGFWIDRTEVTNRQFRAFVEATGHVTTAERPVDWADLAPHLPADTPPLPPSALEPGSLVFVPTGEPEPLADPGAWWVWTRGADWRHPEGPGSNLAGRDEHPVVHVSWSDAAAYAAWAGKRLPTEAEWERAARFGRDGARFTWGDELLPGGRHMANLWQGRFPERDLGADGYTGPAPVGSFPPNALGLFDMAGNVWEWTQDPVGAPREPVDLGTGTCPSAPGGVSSSIARVMKGGSFLCHASYCASYRPSARMATSPDSSFAHTGFRCVSDDPPPLGTSR